MSRVRLIITLETEKEDDPSSMESPFAFSMRIPMDLPNAQILAVSLAKHAVASVGVPAVGADTKISQD